MAVTCRVLAVSTAGYYEWGERAPSARAVADQALSEQIVEIFEWIEGWYNPRRRHTSIGDLNPVEYERRPAAAAEAA